MEKIRSPSTTAHNTYNPTTPPHAAIRKAATRNEVLWAGNLFFVEYKTNSEIERKVDFKNKYMYSLFVRTLLLPSSARQI